MKSLLLASVLVVSASFAHATDGGSEKHPCQALKKACESAGFLKGHHKAGKGLYKDCLDKISKGESVPGVTVSTEEVQACKSKHEAKAAK